MNVELTIKSKTLLTTFFIIDGKGSYSLLLGRDWIHANCCVPSTMHQCLIQWHGDDVELILVDDSVSQQPIQYIGNWKTSSVFLASYGKEASLRSMMKANSRSRQSAESLF